MNPPPKPPPVVLTQEMLVTLWLLDAGVRIMGMDRDWTVRPGATLKDWREENGLSARVTAKLCKMDRKHYEQIEAGKRKVTRVVACKLQQGTGISANLWLKFERMYREDLTAGRKDFDA